MFLANEKIQFIYSVLRELILTFIVAVVCISCFDCLSDEGDDI